MAQADDNNKQELLKIFKINKDNGKTFTKGFAVLNKNIINSIKANISVGKSITGAVMALGSTLSTMTGEFAAGFAGMIEAEKKALAETKNQNTEDELNDEETKREGALKGAIKKLPKGTDLLDPKAWAKWGKGILAVLGVMLLGLIKTLAVGLLALITGALTGAMAGMTKSFVQMYKYIFGKAGQALAKIVGKLSPKWLTDLFGKDGKIMKFFGDIKKLFTNNKNFKKISDGFKWFGKQIKAFGASVMKFLKPIIKMFKGIGSGGGYLGKFLKFFKVFFKIFTGFFAKLFWPIQAIISIIDGFNEADDAVKKSDGMLASWFNGIVGFFGGILDGLIFGMLDLVKDGISWIAGFLGFEKVEKFLDSFSFSDMFNKFLDDVYLFFNNLFNDPMAALVQLWNGLTGAAGGLIDLVCFPLKKAISWLLGIFGFEEASANVDDFSVSGMIGDVFDKAVKWLKGIFGWDTKDGKDGGFSIGTLIDDTFNTVVKWFKGLFGFEGEKGALDDKEFSIIDFISESISKVWTFMKDFLGGIFNFAGIDVGAMLPKFDFDIGNPLKIVGEKLSAIFKGLADFAYDKMLVPDWFGDLFSGVATKVGAWGQDDAGPKAKKRSGGLVQQVTGEQVPAILHANEIVLAESSAKLFLQAAQMFADPKYTNAMKDMVKANANIKTETTDAIMQAGAMGGGDGGTSQMIAALAQQTSAISQTMAQIPGAVQEGANSGTFSGSQSGGFSKLSNPHEKKAK